MKSDERRRIASFRDNWPHEGVTTCGSRPPFATASGRRALPECLPDPRKQPVLLDPFGIRAIVGVAHQVALFRLRPRVVDQVDRDGAQCMSLTCQPSGSTNGTDTIQYDRFFVMYAGCFVKRHDVMIPRFVRFENRSPNEIVHSA